MNTLSLIPTLLIRQPNIKGKAMLLAGAMARPVQTRRWLRFLRDDPTLWALATSQPRLCLKIFRPYLSTRLDCAGRVSVLIQHYQFMLAAGFGNFITQTALRPKT